MRTIVLVLILLLSLISCSKSSQLKQTTSFDGSTYVVCTYTTGLLNIPKDAFHMETQTTHPQMLDSIKKNQWEIGVEFINNY